MLMGTSQILSVPNALVAGNVMNNDDDDPDPTNELQTLSISGDTIFLSNGGFARLPVSYQKGNNLLVKADIAYPFCNDPGDSYIKLVISGGVPPYEIFWSTGDTTLVLDSISFDTYTVMVREADGYTATNRFDVTMPADYNQNPVILDYSIIPVSETGATDGSIEIETSEGNPPFSFLWSGGQTGRILTDLGTGNYSVNVFDKYDCMAGQLDDIEVYIGFIDERDGQAYKKISIGNQVWMGDDLNVYMKWEDHWDNGGYYGWQKYYTFPILDSVCPAGWHVPTDEEWKIPEAYVDESLEIGNPILDSIGWRGSTIGTQLNIGGSIGFDAPLNGYWWIDWDIPDPYHEEEGKASFYYTST